MSTSTNFGGMGKGYRHETTINILSEDVLLEIFFFCERYDAADPYRRYYVHGAWHTLVHVCQRWRRTIFASPRRLDLTLLCTDGTPVRQNLDHFPTLPIAILYGYPKDFTPDDEDNLSAALEHPDLVVFINIYGENSQLGKAATVMQESFPVLTVLRLASIDRTRWNLPVLPDGFLGGSAPCLQEIKLDGVPFPALPTLLSSANDLVVLRLEGIPGNGYVSLEAMIVCLATMTRLKTLHIKFQSPSSHPDQIHLPPETRAVLPALTSFEFRGFCEYLEGLVSRIDSPQLDRINISIMRPQLADFRVAQLVEFVNRSYSLQPTLFSRVTISCEGRIYFSDDTRGSSDSIVTSCEALGWVISDIVHVLSQFSAILSYVAHLKFCESSRPATRLEGWQPVGMGDTEWPQLLHLFTAVRTLYIPEELSGQIALALEGVAREMVTDVLPALSLLYLENQPASSVETFVAVRRDSGRPVITVNKKTEFDTRLQSYLSK